MKEQMKFVRKLPEPIEVQQEIPLRAPYRKLKAERDQAIENIMTGKDDRLLLIIGPCSADNEPAVLAPCESRGRSEGQALHCAQSLHE